MIAIPLTICAILLLLPLYFGNFYFISFFALIPIFYIIQKSNLKNSFIYGWIFGIAYITFSSYWLYYPMSKFSNLNPIIILFLLLILFIVLGVFYAFWAWFLKFISFGAVRAAVSWTAIEFLRYKLFSAFPVAFLAYTQSRFRLLLQWTDIGGIFLISFIIVLINAYLYKFFKFRENKYLILLLILTLILGSYGVYNLNNYNNLSDKKLKVAITKTSIDQEKKWNVERIEENMEDIFNITQSVENIDFLIAPETSLTFDPLKNEYYRKKLYNYLEKYNFHIQLGAQSFKEDKEGVYNSVFLFNPENEIINRYDKNKLVLFGEKIPFVNLINNLTNSNWNSLSSGDDSPLFEIDNFKWKNLICSEILYPIVKEDLNSFDFIVNQSNEAWFESGLQKQIWNAAIFRAVESRKNVLRSGNKAISGVISPTGKIIKSESINSNEIIVNEIFSIRENTFYNKYGNYAGYISLIFLIVLLLINIFYTNNRRSEKGEEKEV